jgi:hypothetical protein
VRFRFILPILVIILGFFLFHLGDSQVRAIEAKRLQENGRIEEPLPEAAAQARYVYYALNAPVWVLLGDRNLLWGPSTYWTGRDLRFFVAVGLLWFWVGSNIDKKLNASKTVFEKKRWHTSLAWLCIAYGFLTAYSMTPPVRSFDSLKYYFSTLLDSFHTPGIWWWYSLGFAWGIILIGAGVNLLARTKNVSKPT